MSTLTSTEMLQPSQALAAFEHVEETKHELDWAEIPTADLSLFDKPGGVDLLVNQLSQAARNIGFFNVINFGLTQDQIDSQFAIGRDIFALPEDEKLRFRAEFEHGKLFGYKPAHKFDIRPGIAPKVGDNREFYTVPKFIPGYERAHPEVVSWRLAEVKHFYRHVHDEVFGKVLVIFARMLGLPDDHLVKMHQYSEPTDSILNYTKYHRRAPDENIIMDNTWMVEHTDCGSVTLLMNPTIAGLQILMPDGSWKWVKPRRDSIVVNIGDTLAMLTNGFLKSNLHRVVSPPADQAEVDRLTLILYLRPNNSAVLRPVESPVLRQLGYDKPVDEDGVGMEACEWYRLKNHRYLQKMMIMRSNVM